MEKLIRNIVDADKAARNQWLSKLDEARKKYMYYNRQYSLYMEKRDEIISKYQKERERCIEEKRSQLESELAAAAQSEEERYQDTLKQLERQVETHREQWVSELVDHCLNS